MTPMRKMKNLSLLGVLALLGCMDDSDVTIDPGSAFEYTVDYDYRLGAVDSNTFEYIQDQTDCSNSQLEVVSDTSTYSYSLAGDTLYILSYRCKKAYTGGSWNQLSGTWTLVSSLPRESAVYPEDCEVPSDYTEKVKFTSSSFTRINEFENYCWSQKVLNRYGSKLGDTVAVKAIGCGTIQATDPSGNVAQRTIISFDPSTHAFKWKLGYNGKSCSYVDEDVEATEPVCADTYAAYQKSGSARPFEWYDSRKDRMAYGICLAKLQVSDDLKGLFF